MNYNLSFTARGNVTAVSRWDVTDINNAAKKLTTYTNYYNTGTPISTTDPAGHHRALCMKYCTLRERTDTMTLRMRTGLQP